MEKGLATHSSILASTIPGIEEPVGLQFMGSQSVGHDWVTNTAETSLLTKRHFTSQWTSRANPRLYLSAFIRRLGGSSRSWLCCTSKTSTEVLSSLSGSLASRLCPASSFRRLLLQNRLCEQGQREKAAYWGLSWGEGLKTSAAEDWKSPRQEA